MNLMYTIEWETLNWEMISSIVTATATVALVIVTIMYVRLLKKQMDDRNQWELSVYFYNGLLSNLQRIVKIPDKVERNYKGHDLGLKSEKQSDPRLLLLLEKGFLDRLDAFDKKNDRYREFLEYAQKEINEILLQKVHDLFGVSIMHMYGVSLRIHPNMLQARKFRDIYSFILGQENPENWIEIMQKQSSFEMEFDFYTEKGRAEDPFLDGRITLNLRNFSELYESVQTCILKDRQLAEFFVLKEDVFREANDLIKKVKSFMRKEK